MSNTPPMRVESRGALHTVIAFDSIRVIELRDGYVDLPTSRLRDGQGAEFDAVPEETPLVAGKLRLAVHAFLVQAPGDQLLIDTGASNSWYPTMGDLPAALDEAGVSLSSITDIAITHNHEDHVNGLIAPDGSETFPRLDRVFIGVGDAHIFTGPLARLRGRVIPIRKDTALNSVVTALPTPGHTAGHTTYDIWAGNGHLLAWGDTIHVPTAQFKDPNISWAIDEDQRAARATRHALLEQLARPGYFVAGAHLDEAGIGNVERDGAGYRIDYL